MNNKVLPELVLHMHTSTPIFYVDIADPKSHSPSCAANTLPCEPSAKPQVMLSCNKGSISADSASQCSSEHKKTILLNNMVIQKKG